MEVIEMSDFSFCELGLRAAGAFVCFCFWWGLGG